MSLEPLLLSMFVVGCQSKNHAKNLNDLFKKSINVTTSKLNIATEDMPLNPSQTLTVGKYLVISANKNKKIFYVYDLEEQEKVYGLFNYGRGHNELTFVNSISEYGNGIIFNHQREIIIIDSLYNDCDKTKLNKIQIPSSSMYHKVIRMNDGSFIVDGSFNDSKKQFSHLDKDFNTIKVFGEYPKDIKNKYSSMDLAMAIQGRLPHYGNKFMFVSSQGFILKFFEYDDSTVSKIKEYIFEVPKFKSVSNPIIEMYGVAYLKETSKGNIAATSSKDTYFLLYKEDQKGKPENFEGGNIIYCFNHKGDPIKKIVMDREMKCIT